MDLGLLWIEDPFLIGRSYWIYYLRWTESTVWRDYSGWTYGVAEALVVRCGSFVKDREDLFNLFVLPEERT
jgi:hypothetical protein